jgi:hypothetical protein
MAFKDQWSDWEVIRRQVALCGRVVAGRALLAGGDVRIEGMKRPKPTAPGEDGIYFFLDLPAGDYTVTFRDATGKRRGKGAGEVSWTAAGDVQRAVVDIAV